MMIGELADRFHIFFAVGCAGGLMAVERSANVFRQVSAPIDGIAVPLGDIDVGAGKNQSG
jgi:hypothetical protein